jgi:hypothetical protein
MTGKALQLFFGCGLFSCLTQISVDVEGVLDRIVVSGQVSTLPNRSFVQVATTASTKRLPFGTSGALVELVDEGGVTYPFKEVVSDRNTGYYTLQGFTATPGAVYHVRVTTGGRVFESTSERVPLLTGTDDISYEFTEETTLDLEGVPFSNRIIQVFSTPSLPESEDPLFLRWNLEEVYIIIPTNFPSAFGTVPPNCFITQSADPQRIVLFDGSNFGSKVSTKVLLGMRVAGQTFHTRHYFISYMGSITPEAHDYWERVNILANQVGSIFDTPPSPITGNIFNVEDPTEPTLGYFQSVNESSNRISLTQNELPFKLGIFCTYSEHRAPSSYPPECLNCIRVRNASYDRPPWFGE